MLTKRQFLSLYDETVLGIRQIKNNNDKINKSIGILHDTVLYKETEAEKQMIEGLCDKVDALVQKMERNYLDPDTARKIGMIKQQLRIQKDRRKQLLDTLVDITKEAREKEKLHARNQVSDYVGSPKKPSQGSTTIELESNSRPISHKDQKQTTASTVQSQVQLQMGDFDYEIQRQLMHQRNKELTQAHAKMLNIKNIVADTANLAYQQGDKLDIITDDMFYSYKNVVLANGELDEANQQHRKSRKKYVVLSLLLLLIVGAVVLLIFGV